MLDAGAFHSATMHLLALPLTLYVPSTAFASCTQAYRVSLRTAAAILKVHGALLDAAAIPPSQRQQSKPINVSDIFTLHQVVFHFSDPPCAAAAACSSAFLISSEDGIQSSRSILMSHTSSLLGPVRYFAHFFL